MDIKMKENILEDLKFLKKYIKTPSPVGYEMILGGQKVWIEEMKKYADTVEIDSLGSAYAFLGNLDSEYTVLIDAHADNVAWAVSEILDSGFIKVNRLGGADHQTAPASVVDVWSSDNTYISGIIGHPAIHLQDRPEKVDKKSIFVDTGYSKDELEKMNIEVGNPITYKTKLSFLGDEFIFSQNLDDKIGGYCNIQLAKKIKKDNIKLPFKLCIVNSCQEEVGLYGASRIAEHIKPNVAIAIDVAHDTTPPCYSTETPTPYTKGCVLTNSPSINKNILKHLKSTAKNNDIKYQLVSMSYGSGTNTDSYTYSGVGVPSGLISLPLRYMHTQTECVSIKNIKDCIELLYNTVINIEENQDFGYKI